MVSPTQYLIITGSYWGFTLTDGALRMLVVLHFHQLGYSPLQIASLFLFYEFFGMVTNLVGGWLAARLGLASTLVMGLLLQIVALTMLLVEPAALTVAWVMFAQALSGIAKDLNKVSAKSGVKLVAGGSEGRLYRWVAALTGSKNALKGVGFFLGGLLLSAFGFAGALQAMIALLVSIATAAALSLDWRMGKTPFKPKFRDVFSKSPAINWLSAARLFLFGSRDAWFVIALPVYLQMSLHWSNVAVATLLALWVIGYGLVQAGAPKLTGSRRPDGRTGMVWGLLLAATLVGMIAGFAAELPGESILLPGLFAFGFVFAVNSAVHSYLIVSYSDAASVSLDVGFYYMSNAAGRLLGTVCSGWVFQSFGFAACLVTSLIFVILATALTAALPRGEQQLTG